MTSAQGTRSKRNWLIYLLLALACIHCARSIFYVNLSFIDLAKYEQGTEKMPFQGRVAMIPVLRWAHSNPLAIKTAAFFEWSLKKTPHMQIPPEDYTPEKLVCMLIGVASVMAMTGAAIWFGQRHLRELWWLPGVLTLAMLFTTYSSRYEIPFWYPYDLPHFALFGVACLLVLEDMLVPAMLLFLVDVPLRETSIYLVPIVLAVGYGTGRLKKAVIAGVFMLAAWMPMHLWIAHRYAHNPSDTGVHWSRIFVLFANPLHWPQLASAFAFMALPLYFGRRYAKEKQRYFLLGSVPCLLVTAAFGIWLETRIWDEWIIPAAVILSTEFVRRFFPQTIPLEGEEQVLIAA